MKKMEEGQAYKNKLEYIKSFNKSQYKLICFRLNKNYDADIIEFLQGCSNVQGLLKQLVRDYKNSKEAK